MAPGLALALAGGGARGLAHLGVLDVLEREGIAVAAIAGTSMGGLLGALHAAGVPLAEIETEITRLASPRHWWRWMDLRFGGWGFSLRGERIVRRLGERIGADRRFEDLDIPLALVTTDLDSGREVVLREGPVAAAARATISVPGMIDPSRHGRMRLADGGLVNNLPVDVARSLSSRPVLAVDVLPAFRANTPGEPPVEPPLRAAHSPRRLNAALHLNLVMIAEATALRLELAPPDLLLRPALPREVTLLFGYGRAAELIAAGRAAANAVLPRLHELASSERA